MRDFMEAVQKAFHDATGWNRDNSYSSLDVSADGLLRFPTPQGLHMTLSSLATPRFATSYELSTVGVVDGSLSYVYSSVPLQKYFTPQSETVSLPTRMQSYRPLSPLNTDTHLITSQPSPSNDQTARPLNPRPSLLYGRLYLPQSMLEALVVKKLSPALQIQLSAVSSKHLRNNGTVLALAQYDVGRYAVEGLASSDGGLLGFRGIYNFHARDEKERRPGHVGKTKAKANMVAEGERDRERDRIYGRFSTGAEIYYGTLNKSGGVSLGARFATLPEHIGTPLTATLTLNPLMGSISASYAVMAGKACSLGTRLDFNVYSYESDWLVGIELWRRRFPGREGPGDMLQGDGGNIIPPKSTVLPKAKEEIDVVGVLVTSQAPMAKTEAPATINPSVVAQRPVVKQSTGFERSFEAKMQWRLDDTCSKQKAPAASPKKTQTKSPVSSAKSSTDTPATASVQATLPTSIPATTTKARAKPAVIALNTQPLTPATNDQEEFGAVIKARLDQNMKIGLLWEGRVKALLFSLGFAIDLRKRDQPFRTVGLEAQYSS